jgi:hypothetical protein
MRTSSNGVFRVAGTCVLTVACGLSAATPRSVVAQATASHDSLPVELVRALIQPYGPSSQQEFFVGQVPPALAPFLYVPKNARVLGGMSSVNATTAVLELPPGSEDVVTAYQREMPKLGWTVPSGAVGRSWGFVPAAGMNMNGNGLEFCHIGQSAQLFPSPDGAGGTRLTITVNSFGGRCGATRNAFGTAQQPEMVRMPTLVNPTGSFMNAQACSVSIAMGGRSNGTTERVQSSLSANQLLDFFAKQLADSGWTSPQATTIVRRSWTHSDGTNDNRELTLSANAITGTPCLDVTMQVRTLPLAVIKR